MVEELNCHLNKINFFFNKRLQVWSHTSWMKSRTCLRLLFKMLIGFLKNSFFEKPIISNFKWTHISIYKIINAQAIFFIIERNHHF